MKRGILVLNAGSSSIKFALYPAAPGSDEGTAVYHGEIEGIGHALHLLVRDRERKSLADRAVDGPATHHNGLSALLEWLSARSDSMEIAAVGHRVVHGGQNYAQPVSITPAVLRELEQLVPLAPLHQPHNLEPIRVLASLQPGIAQVACFDTAFHAGQPAVATTFALPRALTEKGVRRYGFHGLSYEYIVSILPAHLGRGADGKIVVAHLGNGASMCAIADRRSVATTMGFSVLDGLVMGRRCGALDPGVLLYLMDCERMTSAEITHMLYEESGLLGVSGISDDMRDLLRADDPRAREAVALFVYRVVRELGSLAAALGGLDAIVFTGGIGEHSPDIRARVCEQAAWLSLALDPAANRAGGPRISRNESRISIWTLATDEELVIARHTRGLL
jgi:acetate kinase